MPFGIFGPPRNKPPFAANSANSGSAIANGTTAVVVKTGLVRSTSLIFVTWGKTAAPAGVLYVSAISAGNSFSVKSTNAGDTTQTFNWMIL